jgi:hypothetical protein
MPLQPVDSTANVLHQDVKPPLHKVGKPQWSQYSSDQGSDQIKSGEWPLVHERISNVLQHQRVQEEWDAEVVPSAARGKLGASLAFHFHHDRVTPGCIAHWGLQ